MGYYASGLVYGLYFEYVNWRLTLLLVLLVGITMGAVLVVPSYFLGQAPFGRIENRT